MFSVSAFKLICRNYPEDLDKLLKLLAVEKPNWDRDDEFKISKDLDNKIDKKLCALLKSESDIDGYNKNRLLITLPNSQVLDIYPDISSFKVHEQSSEIFAEDIKIEDHNREVAKDLEQVKQRLIEEGILQKNNEHFDFS